MQTLEEYRDQLLAFLHAEQDMAKADKELQKQMTRQEKLDASLLLPNIHVTGSDDGVYTLHVPDNYSKLRAGDKVIIREENGTTNYKAIVLDNLVDTMTIETEAQLSNKETYEIETESLELLQSLIGCLEGISAGKPGAALLRVLSREEPIECEDFLKLDVDTMPRMSSIMSNLNTEQQDAVRSMLTFPPVHVLQGPPGTGKTFVLAATAIAASQANREVVVVANTHHAVNNALLKIHKMDSSVPLFKIGEELKAEELGDKVMKFRKFADYSEYAWNKRKKKRNGHVVGMTIWGAITFLGLHQHSYFRPYIALVDEASQMPLTYASILGKCATSVCLFGDSRQMPPIFRPELGKTPLSVSILDYCFETLHAPMVTLTTTYRMNGAITNFISRHFYEPHGVTLRTENLTPYGPDSFIWCDNLSLPAATQTCTEENESEANAIAEDVNALFEQGVIATDIAIITPYRKQVMQLRRALSKYIQTDEMPLIDTVERLQGQDVQYIFLSFAVSVPADQLTKEQKDFLLNPNRLNVMISRAKSYVRIYAPEWIWDELFKVNKA